MGKQDDFRDYIVRELERRQKRNPAYSLSAFARDLKMSPQKLSQVLKGISGLSPRAARDIGPDLNLTALEVDYFYALIDSRHARSELMREQAKARIERLHMQQSTHELQPDVALSIASWQHWAAYLLTEIEGFTSDLKWIAKRLDLSEDLCDRLYSDLFAYGLLQRADDGRWLQTQKKLSFSATKSSHEIRNFYRQILQLASEAIEDEPVEKRYTRVNMLPLRTADFEKVKERIEEFAYSVLNEYGLDATGADRIYSIAVQLFPIDKACE